MANTLEQRKKLIKARQERLARDAKKQGITPEQLLKKKRDTYLGVVGGAALGALPFGAIARGATALFKGIGGAAKVSKVGKTVAKGAKKVADTTKKLKTSKTPAKDVTKTSIPKVRVKSMKGSGASGASKEVMKKFPTTKTKTPTRTTTKTKTPTRTAKKTDTKKKISGSTIPKVIGGAGAAGILTSLLSKKDGKAVAMPKGRPKSIKPKTKDDFGMGRMDDFGQGRRKGSPEGGTAPIQPKKKDEPKKTAPKMQDMPKKKSKSITAGGNVGFGPKGNIFPSNAEERKKLMNKYGGTGSAAAKAAAQGKQGSLKKVGRT
jgi:hypothetical protein